jgi:3-isopropylmalate dehydrogenase
LEFDVIAAPNMFGDVLADLAAVLLGSRAMSFSGNFTPQGHGVYQTNHGAAYDLAGTDEASPVGQILSLAMMLRHSFGLEAEASAIEQGIQHVWHDGWRTREVMAPTMKLAGTRKITELIASAAVDVARRAQ